MGAGVEGGRARRIDATDVENKSPLIFNLMANVAPNTGVLRTLKMSDALPKWPLRTVSALC
jgi:hypothetical protein